MLKSGEREEGQVGREGQVNREEAMKALGFKVWETHQSDYVVWHFHSQRYRAYAIFEQVSSSTRKRNTT